MVKIALIGAAGQIGTPLSLLCKTVSNCKTLELHAIGFIDLYFPERSF